MPHIIVQCPVLTRAQRAAAVAEITDAFSRATGIEAANVVVHVQEHSYDEIGVGGRLLSDLYPELREKERRVREQRGASPSA